MSSHARLLASQDGDRRVMIRAAGIALAGAGPQGNLVVMNCANVSFVGGVHWSILGASGPMLAIRGGSTRTIVALAFLDSITGRNTLGGLGLTLIGGGAPTQGRRRLIARKLLMIDN